MDTSTLKARAKRAAGWPLRRALDPRLEGLRNELSHSQELSASATQESMEALAVGMRLLRSSVVELADAQTGRDGSLELDEVALLRSAALGGVAGSGARTALSVGEEMGGALAAFGIESTDPAESALVDLVVVVSRDLAEHVPLGRLAAGGTLVLAVGRAAPPSGVTALTDSLVIEGSVSLAPAGAAGFDVEPNDPARADVARLIVARRS